MSKNEKNMKFTVKMIRPVCRTPIKPVIRHKNEAEYSRKFKNLKKMAFYE